jgi:RHS repeat-associated protein
MTSEVKVIGTDQFKTMWSYNSADLVKTMTYPGGNAGQAGEVVTSTYNRRMGVDGVTGTSTYIQSTTYDAAGRLDIRTLGGNQVKVDYDYYGWTVANGLGRLWKIQAGTPGSFPANPSLQNLIYTYDAVGNILFIDDYKMGSPQKQTFTYDNADRLESAAASGGTNGTYPTENYNYNTTSGNLESKAGRSYTYDATKKHAVRRVNGSGGSTKSITIRAKGTPAEGVWPAMVLYVNGQSRYTWSVTSSSYANYTYNTTLTGSDIIEIAFTNDGTAPGEDRNLFIDYVVVDGRTIQAEGGAAVIDRGQGSAGFDGQDMLPGQEALNWNGVLRLAAGPGAFAGGYDGNGNLTSRVVDGAAYLFSYDAENRLVGVSVAITASFTYDGDGNRVKSVIGGVTTTFIGAHFEWTGSTSTMVRYYFAGGERVAMRSGATLYYLFSDHLGSTSVTATSSGSLHSRQLYKPWGEVRYTSGSLPTKYTFTGQYSNISEFGLLFYNARWVDPVLGRFTSPDSIVPNPGNPLDWDRYSYVRNNPINYRDPSGNNPECGTDGIWCDDSFSFEERFSITFAGETWTSQRKYAVQLSILLIASRMDSKGKNLAYVWAKIFRPIKFTWESNCDECRSAEVRARCGNNFTGDCAAGGGYTISGTHIKFASMSGEAANSLDRMTKNVIHELGHAYDNQCGFIPRTNMPAAFPGRRAEFLRENRFENTPDWQQNSTQNPSETFADMFIAWAYNAWNENQINVLIVDQAKTWMAGQLP